MMDVDTAIYTRRSVRKYKRTPVPKQLVQELLEAANMAPSATNRQPWEFVVVNRSFLDRLEETLKEAFQERVASVSEEAMRRAIKDLSLPDGAGGDRLQALGAFYRTLGGAPVAVGVCLPREKDPWVWKNNISDSAAAIENLLLAAWGKGLGSCWMTGPLKGRADAIASFLGVPADRELIAIIALGYPDHQPSVPPKKDVAAKTRWIGFD
ncbi:MAG: nitroreductase family protein [Desulfobacterales bacterium]|jgi:nitroreductase|nr:nitroreductase family protein [Desulfobacterales bacterium]